MSLAHYRVTLSIGKGRRRLETLSFLYIDSHVPPRDTGRGFQQPRYKQRALAVFSPSLPLTQLLFCAVQSFRRFSVANGVTKSLSLSGRIKRFLFAVIHNRSISSAIDSLSPAPNTHSFIQKLLPLLCNLISVQLLYTILSTLALVVVGSLSILIHSLTITNIA